MGGLPPEAIRVCGPSLHPPEAGGLGATPPSVGGKGVWGGRFLQFFDKITHFSVYFGQNSYFKAVTDQLKTFKISLNVLIRINKV